MIAALFTGIAAIPWGRAALRYGAIALAVLLFLPWLDTSRVRSARFRPIYKWVYWLLFVDVVVLTWVGGQVPDTTIVYIGQVATAYYFFHFLILMPLLGKMERPLALPDSINKPVLGQAQTQPAE